MVAIVINGLDHRLHPLASQQVFARVEASIVTWKIAARNLEPNAVTFAEKIGRRPEIDADVGNSPGTSGSAFSNELRKRSRSIPSAKFLENPSG